MAQWRTGDRLEHRFNLELGPGRVIAVEGRTLTVQFPQAGEVLRLSADSDALRALRLAEGSTVRHEETGLEGVLARLLPDGRAQLSDGSIEDIDRLWPIPGRKTLVDRLAQGEIDRLLDAANRLDALHLSQIREADGLGSFLGGRIRLFPHQLYVAERATRSDPVRWLLADEVGLGKTVEACLIQSRLVRTARVESVLVVAPETLTIQWLGELWRKFHQVFVLIDDKRIADVDREFGEGFNPFDTYRFSVVSLERLADDRRLAEQSVAAGFDLVIVDEAHHLQRPPGHPGNAAYRAVASLAEQGRHLLLLSATPLEEDAHGFLRLVELLHPEAFEGGGELTDRLERGEPLPPCTSATRRVDLGGLEPRAPRPIELPEESLTTFGELERALRRRRCANPVQERQKIERIRRAYSSGAALRPLLGPDEAELAELAARSDGRDPRLDWLARAAARWKLREEKTLVFVSARETLELLRQELSTRSQIATGVFHEDLSPARRDIEVAQFRLPGGPSMLISTECGGEGRNFEFCHRLVMFDLPWSPGLVEQRIGRLDRIGRSMPVEVVYFRPAVGLGAAVASLYESIGLMDEPLGGLQRELGHIERAVESMALAEDDDVDPEVVKSLVREAREAHARIRDAAYHELHRDPFRPELGPDILARVPEELDALNEEVVTGAGECLALAVEPGRGERAWSVEMGKDARIDSLPGVPDGFSYLGTFDRETAVADEMIDFFSSGHALVEGILAELEDSDRGRTALLHVEHGDEAAFGLLACYRSGEGFCSEAVDLSLRPRPDLARLLTERPLRTKRVDPEAWTSRPEWRQTIEALAEHLRSGDQPELLAAFMVAPRRRR